MSGPISGPVIGQYFGLFNGLSKADYAKIVDAAPFEKCNLLILAFVRTQPEGANYVARFSNWRDDDFKLAPDDTDEDRVVLVTAAARARNPDIKILVSLGWGRDTNDTGVAAKTPVAFAESIAAIVKNYGLDGMDFDYERVTVDPGDMLTLAREVRRQLDTVTGGKTILTITPAKGPDWLHPLAGLSKDVLETFTYVMPQTYQHGGDGTTADPYKDMLGSFDRIVYGINTEGYIDSRSERPDDPARSVGLAQANKAAGVFAWRLDNDAVVRSNGTKTPTFAGINKIWNLMHATKG